MDSPVTAELREILKDYDLGELAGYEKNERGFVNTAYAIYTLAAGERKRYFLRKYKRGIGEEEILFEHSLLEHLVATGAPVARIHHTRFGKSYLHRYEDAEDRDGVFYTIFDYLPGEDRFTWVNPILTERELSDSARVLAKLHVDAGGFIPLGRRAEPKILDLLPVIAETWSGCPARSKENVFDQRIRQHFSSMSSNIAATISTLGEPGVRSLPQMVIHCDYHPGNLKFSAGSVTGVFDFDWSKIDLRLFDVGLALWYFCTSWGTDDGKFLLERARTFLHSYHETVAAHPGAATITAQEAHYLPVMINAGNLYVMHWTILDYFAKDVDAEEYLAFLDHSLNFAGWYEKAENCDELRMMIAEVLSPLPGIQTT